MRSGTRKTTGLGSELPGVLVGEPPGATGTGAGAAGEPEGGVGEGVPTRIAGLGAGVGVVAGGGGAIRLTVVAADVVFGIVTMPVSPSLAVDRADAKPVKPTGFPVPHPAVPGAPVLGRDGVPEL